ncbi:MAG: exo-beta-N-acetylmuramidase NamZ domain-containing protein, partial [Armatimonadaceae bacterium]
FGPEHGIRGAVDERVPDSADPKTGIPVISLYGPRTAPEPSHLVGIDALVYDIQDIGCRYYTYVSTLVHCMRAAATAGLPLTVLDRPNPISGVHIEGPVADSDKLSFVAIHPMPIRHGMTLGELAMLANRDAERKCDLTIVKVEGWKRRDWFDATGGEWVDPSPNMRSLVQANIYPGPAQLEFTNVSVGRGTATPFQLFGAPWLDHFRFVDTLSAMQLPGIGFVPRTFKPTASKFAGVECKGVELIVTNRESFRPVETGVAMAIALRKVASKQWEMSRWQTLLCHKATYDAVEQGAELKDVTKLWEPALQQFKNARQKVLLYR